MIRFDGKTVLVTGGGTGFGLATAWIARELGAQVAIAGRRIERLREAAGGIGADVLAVQADVSREDDVARMISAVRDRFGRLDVLVNNAGVIHRVALAQDEVTGWDRVMAVNLRGVFLCCKHAIPMLTETQGSIVNISSVLALAPRPGGRSTGYDASKAGVLAITRSVAVAHGPAGVRCNAVCPGFVITEMTRDISDKWTPQERETFLAAYPLRRLGTPDEVAKSILFLASDAASWITGQTLIVDGGQMATL